MKIYLCQCGNYLDENLSMCMECFNNIKRKGTDEMELLTRLSKVLGMTETEASMLPGHYVIEVLVGMMEKKKSIDQLCEEAYQTAKDKGWHDDPREMGTLLMLIVGEVAEAMEADRRNEGSARITEELADVCIRVFDLCGDYGFDLERAIKRKMMFNQTRTYKHGGKKY